VKLRLAAPELVKKNTMYLLAFELLGAASMLVLKQALMSKGARPVT
jgi:hypothetical protein